jgi:hypothetical protein
MNPLEVLEQRRQRGLYAVRELEAVEARRPLMGFEQRAMRRNRSLVQEMDEQIRALLSSSTSRHAAQIREDSHNVANGELSVDSALNLSSNASAS